MASSIFSARAPHVLIGVLAILAAAGCTNHLQERQLIPPTDSRAQACVASCDLSRSQCEQRQRVREDECRLHYERLSADHETCLATPGALCIRPDTCPAAEMTICTIQYEECIVGCGGSVETRFSLPRAASG
ncbi:hypothetical protein [Thiocapsa sp.]|uniref:hypothetical protein n=1 Tax=Thiocapsa sp. TaxID=2024551 RepID=UPI0025D1DFA2|nr:hypothetical protein [Thiocapsa sp.]